MRTTGFAAVLTLAWLVAATVSADERDPADEAARLKAVWASGDAFAYDYNPLYEFTYRYPAQAFAVPALAKHLDRNKQEALAGAVELGESRRNDPKSGPAQPFTHATFWTLAGDTPRLISLEAELIQWVGGVHGEHGSDALLWDKQTGKPMESRTLIAGALQTMRKDYCAALDRQREEKAEGGWKAGKGDKYMGQWECPGFDQLTIVFAGNPGQPFDTVRLIADPYVAGPFSDGYYRVELPVTRKLREQVAAEYRNAFLAR